VNLPECSSRMQVAYFPEYQIHISESQFQIFQKVFHFNNAGNLFAIHNFLIHAFVIKKMAVMYKPPTGRNTAFRRVIITTA
jgi:hypothetical protein